MADEMVGHTDRLYYIRFQPDGEVLFTIARSAVEVGQKAVGLAESKGFAFNGNFETRPATLAEVNEFMDTDSPELKGRHS